MSTIALLSCLLLFDVICRLNDFQYQFDALTLHKLYTYFSMKDIILFCSIGILCGADLLVGLYMYIMIINAAMTACLMNCEKKSC